MNVSIDDTEISTSAGSPGGAAAARNDLSQLAKIRDEAQLARKKREQEQEQRIQSLLPTREQLDTLSAQLCQRMTEKINADIKPIVERIEAEMIDLAQDGKSSFEKRLEEVEGPSAVLWRQIRNACPEERMEKSGEAWVREMDLSQTDDLIQRTVREVMQNLAAEHTSAITNYVKLGSQSTSILPIAKPGQSFEVSQDLFEYFCKKAFPSKESILKMSLFPFIASYFASVEGVRVEVCLINSSYDHGGDTSGHDYRYYEGATLKISW
jgi:hypothetical protein